MTVTTPAPTDAPASISAMNERQLLDALLTAEARKVAAGAVITDLRVELRHRAEEHQARTGLAWKGEARGIGRAHMTDPQDRIVVTDGAAFGAWVGEHYPEHAAASITVPATALSAVLEALDGVLDPDDRPVRVDADPKWTSELIADAAVIPADGDDPEGVAQVVTAHGEVPDGLGVTRTAQSLSVTLDREAKARAAAELVQPHRLRELTADLPDAPSADLPAAGGR